jgi:hypothetical protein
METSRFICILSSPSSTFYGKDYLAIIQEERIFLQQKKVILLLLLFNYGKKKGFF